MKNVGSIRISGIEKSDKKSFLVWWYQPLNKNIKTSENELEWRINYFTKNITYLQVSYLTSSFNENIFLDIHKELNIQKN